MNVTTLAKLYQPNPKSPSCVGLEFKAGIGAAHMGSIGTMLGPGQGVLLMVNAAGALQVSKVAEVVVGELVQLSMFGLAETLPPQEPELTLPPPAI
jgi:hypothetical protein